MFKWLKKLWRSYTIEPPIDTGPQYEVGINNTQFTNEQIAEVIAQQAMFGGSGQVIIADGLGHGQYQNIQVPIDYGQQQLGQQQMAAAEQTMYMDGTYGAMQQQRQLLQHQSMFGQDGLLNSTYGTFMIELKANGMPEPDIKQGDMLGVEITKWHPMLYKLKEIAGSSNLNNKKYGKMYEIVSRLRAIDKTKFKGDWGYDLTLDDYIVQTSYSSQHLPLSIFMKLPQTIAECKELMEKTIWSSRKLPITKKDIL